MDKYVEILGKIKDLKRTGWQIRKVSDAESVADHSFGVALLTYLLCPDSLDKQKCLEFAIIHDLAEAIVGDFTPKQISKEEKHKLEIEAIQKIATDLNYPKLAEQFIEYEKQDCEEAKFVKKADRLDSVLQAKYYQEGNRTTEYQDNPNIKWESLYQEFSTNNFEANALIEQLIKRQKK
ncbi:MAG: HD domain-containing protein [Alphaproteobacteria bacterium]|nr:HD domain-containing protein [Alphaproteobacteria bacterium]